MNVSSWTVRARLTVGFGIVCAMLLAIMGIGLFSMSRIESGLIEVVDQHVPKMGAANTVASKIDAIAIALRNMMLTQDQSIVDMQFAVQYRLSNPVDYLFNNNPGAASEDLVRQGAEAAMREIVGRKGIDQVLYEEKEAVAKESQKLMQAIVDRYKAGVGIIDVTIQQAQPPEQVQAAFEDANKAAQDRERLINEGRAYANDVIPKARGNAARLGQEADGYRQRVIATADGDASRFKQVLTEYSKAPQVTRQRMYLETMQQVFVNTSKVYVDSRGSGNLLYLPLDKLMQQTSAADAARATAAAAAASGSPAQSAVAPATPERADAAPEAARGRDGLRSRDRDAAR